MESLTQTIADTIQDALTACSWPPGTVVESPKLIDDADMGPVYQVVLRIPDDMITIKVDVYQTDPE